MNRAADAGSPWSPAGVLCVALVLGGLLVLIVEWVNNNRADVGNGRIELTQISFRRLPEMLMLDAQADIVLPATMQAGLDNGVPLTFIMSVRLIQDRRWWFDRTVSSFEKRYTLTYYDLTRHYRVHAVDANVSQNYRSLSSALAGLGRFNGVSFAWHGESAPIKNKKALTGTLRLHLDTAALPLPLQPLIRSNWKLASEEYQWQVI
ncbi:MAG: DUF4390 domain-containing protein [Granulosicoccus sp.]|nr:DUF4390 domain-containing protein [Granulosicoccus sp.]